MTSAQPTPAQSAPTIELAIEAEGWTGFEQPLRLAEETIGAAAALGGVALAEGAEVSVLLCDDAFIADLNRKWRGLDRPTNVLSFPSGGDLSETPILGDIAIAYETAAREAQEAGKPLRDHVAHLLAHGFLHLIGYDHIDEDEALEMEALEREILARLGIDDPYKEAEAAAAN
ncbi:rRNA maturation RNase YbeY [Methylocapsa acidiphila]|uniref:rRNA maturation RNase YbeY n=1 Tax=Methylocapsa acidiphila TaxID=133552 RepID=UPI000418C478|nr:rRNA maturation RNase YbeY [Methylocapsa acidiphila]